MINIFLGEITLMVLLHLPPKPDIRECRFFFGSSISGTELDPKYFCHCFPNKTSKILKSSVPITMPRNQNLRRYSYHSTKNYLLNLTICRLKLPTENWNRNSLMLNTKLSTFFSSPLIVKKNFSTFAVRFIGYL